MRTVSFRDDVLWAIAQKLGFDPETNLQKNQAYAYATYINSWVRRLWDVSDWSEWTTISPFAPVTTGSNHHIVSWDSSAYTPTPILGTTANPVIGKVLKVYLLDPRTTWTPVETPFRLTDQGIHCGFEHGALVWIKFVPRCPQFTAREWENGITYNRNSLTYSPSSGECYRSKSSNNRGHDPSQSGSGGGPAQPLLVEETPGTQDNPGLAAQSGLTDVFATAGRAAFPDPPLGGSFAKIIVLDSTGATLATATHTATGSQSLLVIYTDLADQLDGALSGFTVTLDPSPLSIRLDHASQFTVTATFLSMTSHLTYPIDVVQAQTYVPVTAPVSGTGQQLRLSITEDQVVPGGTYLATFTTVDNVEHEAPYTALSTDNAQQILSGLIDSTIAMQGTDTFFTGVSSSLDTVSPSATFTIAQTLGTVSLNPVVIPPGAVYWELVPFPFALVDQVIRGVIADARGEQGQTDKQAAEEQVIPSETKLRLAAQTGSEYDGLSDQQRTHSRYSVK